LAQAVEDQIVKTPILVKSHLSEREGKKKPKRQAKISANQYAVWIRLGVERLKALEGNYKGVVGAKPVMFVMCENVAHAEDVAKFLKDGRQGFGIKDEEVLVIHTKGSGEIKDGDLDELRRQSRLIDQAESKIRIVVSVLILREGWDVRNVSVVLGLRPANSKNEILPEQAVGRGLRLMRGVHGRQILEVIGTQSFEDLIGQLEVEGVHIETTEKPPKSARIEPLQERKKYDIAIPQTGPQYNRSHKKLTDLRAEDIRVNFTPEILQIDLAKIPVQMIDIASGTELAATEISAGRAPLEGEVLSAITNQVIASAHLTQADYQVLYPIVKRYVTDFAFGQRINLELDNMRRLLALPVYEEGLAGSIADAVGRVVTEFQAIKVERSPILLSETDKFIWRRQTEKAEKTVFNLMATFNDYESGFGRFLDAAADVRAFAALAETFTRFFVDYLKPTGAMGRYYPDWVIHQRIGKEDRFWIAETKGREFEGVEQKDAAIIHWCSEVSKNGRNKWGYMRVNQDWWNTHEFTSFEQVARGIEVHQKNLGATGLYFWPGP
jgi:type III restriction enzyme